MNKDLEKFDLACTYLKNDQNISAHNLLMSLAEKEMKNPTYKAGVYLILASECKSRQGKDKKEELLAAAKLYLKLAKKIPSDANYAYQCAAKCFLKIGQFDEAMKAYDLAKKYMPRIIEEKRPIIVVDDSQAILIRIKNFLQQLGYEDIQTINTGKAALSLTNKLIKLGQNPILLLDMDMPDVTGDVIAKDLLKIKPDISIILITADEKTTPRVTKTIGFGSTAFVQKPFTINELKNALDTAKMSEIN